MANKIVNQIKKLFQSQLAIPLVALIVLVVFNLIRDPSFFSIVIKKNNLGNNVLSGNLISAQIRAPGKIRMRVWERGCGVTMACGTGSCATLVAAQLTGRAGEEADILLDGGTLHIQHAEDGPVLMTGPAKEVYRGETA